MIVEFEFKVSDEYIFVYCDVLCENDFEVYVVIFGEEYCECIGIEFIFLENYIYFEVFVCNGLVMMNKYVEGYFGWCYYGG